MRQSLDSELIEPVRATLREANRDFTRSYPGVSSLRQPVHTVYGGAQIFSAQTARKMSEQALNALHTYAPNGPALARALGQDGTNEALWSKIHARVVEKLKREAVEDFRIDFEDGYGVRPDAEEDGHAKSAALEVAQGMKGGTLPPFIGIRIKPFNDENCIRSIRTLDIFLTTLLSETGGKLPPGFVVTLPKITITEQSHALTQLLAKIESCNHLPPNTLKFELMVETPQSILGKDGRSPLREFVEAGQGRCIAAHFGTYDYTAGCDITAAHQTMSNPVCDFAKHMMQVSLAGMPIFLSDGATNIFPVGPHKATEGKSLTAAQALENETAVFHGWRISYRHIRHSLVTGFYQGWDLHPAQLPVRYAATYAFFLEGLEQASNRLKSFMEKAARATLLGEVFDDAATGQGLLNFFLRGMSCSAITEAEALGTGLTLEEIRSRSFLKILQGRTSQK
jgi:citrate lyase beta subunit